MITRQSKSFLSLFIPAILLVIVWGPHSTHQWGFAGHKITAILANNMLSDSVKKIVFSLINNTIPNIASLPDKYDHTSAGHWSFYLHFADLPHNVSGFVLSRDCPSHGCVVSAIKNYTDLTIKRINGLPWNFPDEPTPLEFLVHFVGDIHQPLHVGYGSDQGGNKIQVSFFNKLMPLHSVWDEAMISKYNSNLFDFASELQTYISQNQQWAKSVASNQNVISWANESYSLVQSELYTFPDGSGTNPTIGNIYYQKEIQTVKKRLMAGGLRLGYLINQICGGAELNFDGMNQKKKITLN